MDLPSKLNRRAIMATFDRLEPVTWEKLFEREDTNGIGKNRVSGDYPGKAYYKTDGVMKWLVSNGHYTVDEFSNIPKCGGEPRYLRMQPRATVFGV